MYPFDGLKILMMWIGGIGSIVGIEYGFEQGNWVVFSVCFFLAIMAIIFKDYYPKFIKNKPERCR